MMRSLILSAALVAATAGASAPKSPDAPADVYFGPFKYSAISVRTKIDALGRAYRERWADDASLVHDAGMVESSFRDWAQRYPQDRWLAPTALHLAELYFEVQTPEARTKSRGMYEYVASTFGSTKQGHLARLRLQQGFPPLHPESPVSPTPSPYGPAPAAAPGSGAPSALPSPSSSAPASSAPLTAPTPAAKSSAPPR